MNDKTLKALATSISKLPTIQQRWEIYKILRDLDKKPNER